jgi:hypothetical protein
MSLPIVAPAEGLRINPENLQVANAYLELANIDQVAEALDMPKDLVSEVLDRKEVRSYINNVYFDSGFNNRFKLSKLMNMLIEKKLQDMDEAGVGSNKDIVEIIAMLHKINEDGRAHELAMEKLRGGSSITNQTNIQINTQDSNYRKLLEKIGINANPTS